MKLEFDKLIDCTCTMHNLNLWRILTRLYSCKFLFNRLEPLSRLQNFLLSNLCCHLTRQNYLIGCKLKRIWVYVNSTGILSCYNQILILLCSAHLSAECEVLDTSQCSGDCNSLRHSRCVVKLYFVWLCWTDIQNI